MLRQRVGGQGSQQNIDDNSCGCNKHRIKQITGKGHPAIAHDIKKHSKAVQGGIMNEQRRRIDEQLADRFEGHVDNENHGHQTEQPEQSQDENDEKGTGPGAVGMTAAVAEQLSSGTENPGFHTHFPTLLISRCTSILVPKLRAKMMVDTAQHSPAGTAGSHSPAYDASGCVWRNRCWESRSWRWPPFQWKRPP